MPRVLVVDDSISVRKALERVLAPRQMEVSAAASGEQALEQLRLQVPDLLIVDVVMPGMSGFELCSSLKADAALQHVPVILISGIVDEGVIAQARAVGALSVVSKPFTPDELFPKIDAALQHLSVKSEVVPAPPAAIPAPAIPATPSGSTPLESSLEAFLEKSEVETVAVVHRNGTVLASRGKALLDPALFGTFARTIASISGVLGEHLESGNLGSVSVEYQRRNLLLTSVTETVVLAVILEGSTGSLKYAVQRQLPQIKLALEAN